MLDTKAVKLSKHMNS